MKSTGMVRKVDQLGRIVIPREIVKTFGIKLNETSMEIFVEGNLIVLRKYSPSCIFCGEIENVANYKGKSICRECLKELKRQPLR